MTNEPLTSSSEPAAAVRREAAVWIARIHSPDRSPGVDAGLRRWLKESPEHQRAFELANELWDTASRVPDGAVPRMMRWKRVAATKGSPLLRFTPALTVALTLTFAAAVYYNLRGQTLTTGIGEQRTITLKDGTRVSLNTATRIAVRYDDAARRIKLESGEALFEVSQDARRPFVVMAGEREITALGTAFIVRRDELQTAVTLVEGRVLVSPVPAREGKHEADTGADARDSSSTLTPGERLTFKRAGPPKLDRPKLDKLTAWQHGLVALDHTRLADAATEMNRYSTVKLAIDTPEAADARISGVFRAGDSLFFAQAIARTYELQVLEEPDRIVITGIPRGGVAQGR